MKIPYKKQIVLSIIAGALLSPGLTTHAQQSSKPQSVQQQTRVSDSELRAFAKAYVEYHKIRQKYEPQLKATKDAQQSKKIQDEANAKIKDVLAKQQLTAQQYNRVFNLVNNDEALRKKAMKLINEERKKG
jgi:uncharacterized protein DUF4168